MPVDFDTLPARTVIPGARRFPGLWLIVAVFVVTAGAAISIATWAPGREKQTLWFWVRSFGLPLLVWLLAYSGWRFLGAHRLQNALADNAAIDRQEEQLHAEASVPFAVIGQSWRFSGVVSQNSIEAAARVRGLEELTGLVIPDRPFLRGNRADEVERHAALLEWLLVELVNPLAHELQVSRTTKIWLALDSMLSSETAEAAIARAWVALGLERAEEVQLLESLPLYALDGWLDARACHARHLVIAVQLRGAISGEMQRGQAEAGTAVLLSSTLAGVRDATALAYAHRPTRGDRESVSTSVINALRWGHCSDGHIDAAWNAGLAEPLVEAFKRLGGAVNDAPSMALAQTIGNVGVAAPWLALSLAAAKAKEGAGAQLILDQQEGDLVAMVCRRKV